METSSILSLKKPEPNLNVSDVLCELVCPVCLNYLYPPIKQCATGHTYCEDCFQKLTRCPECRAPKTEARSFVLERLYNKLTFPCKFYDEGCQVLAKGVNIKYHEDGCEYSMKRCPLRFNNNCKWQGKKLELDLHCKKDHSTNIYFESSQTFKCKDFCSNVHRKYYILFSVFEEMFRCSMDINEEKGLVRFGVYLMSKIRSLGKFVYQLTIKKGDTELEAMSVKAPCIHLTDDAHRFEKDKYLIFKYNMLKEFCGEAGDLYYSVKIIPTAP
ncbi:unnamed protein product [Brassicogethes aeneus]|uniref:RING-type E3 ubiquitin transferase n=1 Tax=Brassicogethes aeneus TaxID=1431903 RepID=A0A9P0BCI7_BRAAE|nr:unnamed protein product [Brassicogethes aeneus]